jgi:hypothetical protein
MLLLPLTTLHALEIVLMGCSMLFVRVAITGPVTITLPMDLEAPLAMEARPAGEVLIRLVALKKPAHTVEVFVRT